MKNKVLICFSVYVYENELDIVKECMRKDGERIDSRMSAEVAEK